MLLQRLPQGGAVGGLGGLMAVVIAVVSIAATVYDHGQDNLDGSILVRKLLLFRKSVVESYLHHVLAI